MPSYRIFIDECGNHDLQAHKNDENQRFLTLFGVIMDLDYHDQHVEQSLNKIKSECFEDHATTPIVLHRSDIVRKRKRFTCLYDKELCARFDALMLAGYKEWNYKAIAVTIDKKAHVEKYRAWQEEAYYYCFKLLIERYVKFLNRENLRGDVMIESRNKDLDKELAANFNGFYHIGIDYLTRDQVQNCLTSEQLKVKEKTANIAGLQLADLLAHPAQYCVLAEHKVLPEQTATFGGQISTILKESKFDRDPATNRIKGFGMKLLP